MPLASLTGGLTIRAVLGLSLLAASALPGCTADDDEISDEELGDIGDGKSDSFGVVARPFTVSPGRSRRFTFTAGAGFRVTVTQPTTSTSDRSDLTLSLSKPDGDRVTADAAPEPSLVVEAGGGRDKFTLTVKNVGGKTVDGVLDVRPLADFGELPNPNAATAPEVSWLPPAVGEWPASYVIFNNTGCGHDCVAADQTALGPRSVMIKMLVAAIDNVKPGGIVRVSNFNISSSASAKPVVDALIRAMTDKGATLRIVMDQGQNNPMSKTTELANLGAEVRYVEGLHYETSLGTPAVGIMHSKIIVVDDEVVLTGSNNFSSTGLITNEENSVVLRGAENADRIAAFQCDIDTMFTIGVPPGAAQRSEDDRKADVIKLDACNHPDVWFPPSGTVATGSSITFTQINQAISNAKQSIYLAPDMFAHPTLVSSLTSRAKRAKAAGQPFAIKLVLDASEEALGNPAFGECLADNAAKDGLDVEIRYWPGSHEIFQLAHHKFMIVDGEDPANATLYNGSANYSAKALKQSFENVTRYGSGEYRAVVDAFTARFHQMFAQGKTKAKLKSEDGITAPACVLGN